MKIIVFIYLFSLTLLCKENRWLLEDDEIIYLYIYICFSEVIKVINWWIKF